MGRAAPGLLCSLRGDQPAQQRPHRRPLVGEDPGVALRAGEGKRLGQGGDGGGLVAAGRQRQCPQRLDFDDATGTVLGDRGLEQALEQRKGPPWAVFREQDPGQHQISPLPRVTRFVVGVQAPLLYPSGSRVRVILGQQQLRPLCG